MKGWPYGEAPVKPSTVVIDGYQRFEGHSPNCGGDEDYHHDNGHCGDCECMACYLRDNR